MELYEFKVSYRKKIEDKQVKVSETYLLDALSYTEAESRATEKMQELINTNFNISKISKVSYADIFSETSGDRFYKVKVSLNYEDENGKMKKDNTLVLIKGDTVKDAYENLVVEYGDSIENYTIINIMESPVLDIFNYI